MYVPNFHLTKFQMNYLIGAILKFTLKLNAFKLHFKCSVALSDRQSLCWASETNVSGFQLWVSLCLMFVLGLKLFKTL